MTHHIPLFFGMAVLVSFAYATYVAYPIVRAIWIDKQLIRNAVPYEQHPQHSSMQILIAGDSTGVGVGANPRGSVAGRIGHDFPGVDITNISVSGYRLADLKRSLESRTGTTYDVVVLQIGANDIVRGTSYSQIQDELNSILDLTDKFGSKTIVLTSGDVGLAPIFHSPLSRIFHTRTLRVRSIFQEEISTHASTTYIDLFKKREDDPFTRDPERYYSSDLFHPSGAGYGIWYAELQPALMTHKAG